VKVTETLRRAIEQAEASRYAIAKATKIEQSSLSRFVHGERGLDGTSIDKLAEYFGLELNPKKKRGVGKSP
jgi:plasmid maintenance system antidote protein VapI